MKPSSLPGLKRKTRLGDFMSAPDLDILLSRLDKVKSVGAGKWLACCPAHDDRNPSLSIKLHDDRVLLHCFASCGATDVLAAIGLDFSALYPPIDTPHRDIYKQRKETPRLSSYNLLKTVCYEASILGVFISDCLLSDKAIIIADVDRVKQALEIISNIRSEVGR